jgi:nitrate reductase delta subunit
MLVPSKNRLDAATQVKRWTRQRFGLTGEATLLVSEIESAVPGFPPLHTVVAFWTAER